MSAEPMMVAPALPVNTLIALVSLLIDGPTLFAAIWLILSNRREHARTVEALTLDNKRLEEAIRAMQMEQAAHMERFIAVAGREVSHDGSP